MGLRIGILAFVLLELALLDTSVGSKPDRRGDHATPVPVFNATEADLGRVDGAASKVELQFLWKNRTTETLSIERVIPSCKCTKVVPSSEKVRPGDTAKFDTVIDLRTVTGHFGSGFTVIFAENHEPVSFVVHLFRAVPPKPRPARVSFGACEPRGQVVRRVVVEAIGDKGTFALRSDPRSTDARVACRVLSREEHVIRQPNSDRTSMKYDVELELTLTHEGGSGDVKGEVIVPVTFAGEEGSVRIPFGATLQDRLIARPAAIVLVLSPGEKKTSKVFLDKAKGTREVTGVTLESSDASVDVEFTARHDAQHMGCIDVAIREPARRSYDSIVTVTAYVDGSPVTVAIPVRIRVIGNSGGDQR